MPAVRAHRKSRSGCDQCKARKVKCDEAGPPCANCMVRELPCTYSKAASFSAISAREHESRQASHQLLHNSNDNLAEPHSVVAPDSKYTLELELMHHYSTSTCLTFCNNTGPDQERQEQELYLFQKYLPRESLRCQFVLHAIFAVTALHLSTLVEPHQVSYYLEAAMEYQNSSLATFKDAFSKLHQQNCHQILLASFGYLIMGIATPDPHPEKAGQQSVKHSILAYLRLLKGPMDIYQRYRLTLASTPFSAILEPKSMAAFAACSQDFKDAFERLRKLDSQSMANAASLQRSPNLELIDELERSARRCRDSIPIAGLSWLTVLPDTFISAVERGDVLPGLIFTHLGVLLHQSVEVWWSVRSGQALVAEMSQVFSDLDGQELQALVWCRQQVGLNIERVQGK